MTFFKNKLNFEVDKAKKLEKYFLETENEKETQRQLEAQRIIEAKIKPK